METAIVSKNQLMHQLARNYVVEGLGSGNFDAIPYHEDVVLRAPLCPGGSYRPLTGRENLREQWWSPLPSLLKSVELLDTYVNEDDTAVTVEFHCHIIEPACTLRVIDRFKIDEEGKITEQENYFDPRDITNPGWR